MHVLNFDFKQPGKQPVEFDALPQVHQNSATAEVAPERFLRQRYSLYFSYSSKKFWYTQAPYLSLHHLWSIQELKPACCASGSFAVIFVDVSTRQNNCTRKWQHAHFYLSPQYLCIPSALWNVWIFPSPNSHFATSVGNPPSRKKSIWGPFSGSCWGNPSFPDWKSLGTTPTPPSVNVANTFGVADGHLLLQKLGQLRSFRKLTQPTADAHLSRDRRAVFPNCWPSNFNTTTPFGQSNSWAAEFFFDGSFLWQIGTISFKPESFGYFGAVPNHFWRMKNPISSFLIAPKKPKVPV